MSAVERVQQEKRMRPIDMLDPATQDLYRAYQLAKLHGGAMTPAMRAAKAEYSRASRIVNPAFAERTRIVNRRWYNRGKTDPTFMDHFRARGRRNEKQRRLKSKMQRGLTSPAAIALLG